MQVIPIRAFTDNYIWAIPEVEAGIFDCVDPGDAQPVLDFAKQQQLKLRTILLTHHHDDHIGGVAQLLHFFPECLVYGPQDSRIPFITNPVDVQHPIQVGKHHFQILENPGHTSSHISYFEPQDKWLFCGDTLFSAGCGRVFDGTMHQLYQAMQLFKSLPDDTLVFCAHEYTVQNLRFAQGVEPNNQNIANYLQEIHQQSLSCTLPSTIQKERLINPFLRTEVPEVQNYALAHGATSSQPFDLFQVLREQKNRFR